MRAWLVFALLLAACASHPSYPEHWWAPLDRKKAYWWEIPPQAAERSKNEVILSKRNELGILSNFAATPFEFRGKRYASVEGFWQMMKYPEGPSDPRWGEKQGVRWEFSREQVAVMTAFKALDAGLKAEENMKKLGVDWVSFEGEKIFYKTRPDGIKRHYELIVAAMKAKLAQNGRVGEVLSSTKGLKLRPDHIEDKDGTISWRYYEIWQQIRDGKL